MLNIISYIILAFVWLLMLSAAYIYNKVRVRTDFLYSKSEFWLYEIFCIWCSFHHLYIIYMDHYSNFITLALIILGIVSMIGWLNSIIQYDETGFITFRFWNKKRRYEYEKVKSITLDKIEMKKKTEDLTYIFFPEEKITVNQGLKNYHHFMEKMAIRYEVVHGQKIQIEKIDKIAQKIAELEEKA